VNRRLAACVTLAPMTLAVTGCGGSDQRASGERAETTVAEFCGALQDFQAGTGAADPSDLTAYVAALKAAADRLDRVGVPKGMPTDARKGFTVTVDRITGLPDQATAQDVSDLAKVPAAEQPALDALDDYIKQTCPAQTGG
jgi:hypothetical protein